MEHTLFLKYKASDKKNKIKKFDIIYMNLCPKQKYILNHRLHGNNFQKEMTVQKTNYIIYPKCNKTKNNQQKARKNGPPRYL